MNGERMRHDERQGEGVCLKYGGAQ